MKRRRKGVLAAVIAVLLGVAIFPNVALAGSHCQRVHGTGLTFQNVAVVGPFEGTAELNLGDADVRSDLLGLPEEKPDGTLHALTSHRFDLEDGSFVTVDKAILAPTETPGLFNVNSRLRICATPDCEAEIVEGEIVNGRALCGRLSVHGTINFGVFPAEADWRVTGKICDCSAD